MNDLYNYNGFITKRPSTAIRVYSMLPESMGCEVIFNEFDMPPSPSREHQFTQIKLTTLLFRFLEDNKTGILLAAPFDVFLEEQQSIVQPDLFVVLNEHQHSIQKNGFHGVPSLIIEIVSTNRTYDTQRKRSLYEKAGVKEYFMIDPENKKVTLLTLNAIGTYDLTYEETGLITSQVLACRLAF